MAHAQVLNHPTSDDATQIASGRWIQLLLGFIVMMAISSPQYVWTLFVKPFQQMTGASLPAVQITISLLIVLQTWLSPLQGALIERFGPRALVFAGCALSGLGWVLAAQATSLIELYLSYGLLCGVGTGIVYVGIIGQMLRWFPDRRGFATGMVAAGYGFGAMLTNFPIFDMLASSGYQRTLVTFGMILGGVGIGGGAAAPGAAGRRRARPRDGGGRREPGDAALARVLADVRDDDDDVDRRADGDRRSSRVSAAISASTTRCWSGGSRPCRWP